uniref:Uncharacterized protein n=1 Tax=Avena sativa TaxID=4498 RepID=A0ACD5U6C7_AVESA
MKAKTSNTTGAEVPSLLAKLEVSHLNSSDGTTSAPRPARVRPLDRKASRSGYRSAEPAVSISMPSSPTGFGEHLPVHTADWHEIHLLAPEEGEHPPAEHVRPSKLIFRSQPMPLGTGRVNSRRSHSMIRDRRYDSFKTHLAVGGGPANAPEGDATSGEHAGSTAPDVDRFFAALEGPELDMLKSSEALVLPADNLWPFLLRFPVSAFGMCLGVSSQAILYKTIATAPPTAFLHVDIKVNLVLWCIALTLMSIITVVYTCKIIFYFEAVRREYYHPVRVNFFFAPWIACMFLAMGVPPSVATELPGWLWYAIMAPLLCLELKIYGQWMSGGDRRLSKVANPSNHLSVVGNFVGALFGASMGLKEGPLFFFGVGMAHYSVLFVTLYQRLPTNVTLPKELHPVFFLFVAAPSVASMAWAKISGEFGLGAKLAYFIAMFLYASLVVRINFFRGFKFSLSWWAYTFPMTGAGIATIRYATVVDNAFTTGLAIGLSLLASLTVMGLFVTTIVHAFVFRNLFPNDIAIAITHKKMKPIMELEGSVRSDDSRSGSSTKDIEAGPTAAVASES